MSSVGMLPSSLREVSWYHVDFVILCLSVNNGGWKRFGKELGVFEDVMEGCNINSHLLLSTYPSCV